MSRIELTSDGVRARLVIDGHDLSRAATSCTIRTDTGCWPTAEVELMLPVSVTVEGAVQVYIPDDTRAALIALGWQAPETTNGQRP